MRKGLIAPSSSLGLSDGTGGEGLVRMGLIAPSLSASVHSALQGRGAPESPSKLEGIRSESIGRCWVVSALSVERERSADIARLRGWRLIVI